MIEKRPLKRFTSNQVFLTSGAFVLLDAIGSLWRLSNERAESFPSLSISVITSILVVVSVIRALSLLESLLGFLRSLLLCAGIWTIHVAVSLIVYRGSPSTLSD